MTHTVIFINGSSGSGKDEFVKYAQENSHCVGVANISSIDCIRELLGITSISKDSETRRLLAEVGRLMEEYNGYRTRETAQAVIDAFALRDKSYLRWVTFVHVRELSMMDSIYSEVVSRLPVSVPMFNFQRLLVVRSDHAGETNNASDAEASTATGEGYNYLIHNDGTLDDLRAMAQKFIAQDVHAPDNAR